MNKKHTRAILIGVAAVVILCGVAVASADPITEKLGEVIGYQQGTEAVSSMGSELVVAQVGDVSITDQDVRYKLLEEQLYSEDSSVTYQDALEELAINLAAEQETERLGLSLTEEEKENIRRNRQENFEALVYDAEEYLEELGVTEEEYCDYMAGLDIQTETLIRYRDYVITAYQEGTATPVVPELQAQIEKTTALLVAAPEAEDDSESTEALNELIHMLDMQLLETVGISLNEDALTAVGESVVIQ